MMYPKVSENDGNPTKVREEPQRELMIPQRMMNLDNAISQLIEGLEKVRARLDPVLMPPLPRAEGEQPEGAPPVPQLVNNLDANILGIYTAIGIVKNIDERLEL